MLGYTVIFQKNEAWLLNNVAGGTWVQSSGVGSLLIAEWTGLMCYCGVQILRLYANEVRDQNLTWYSASGFLKLERRLEDRFLRVYLQKASVGMEALDD